MRHIDLYIYYIIRYIILLVILIALLLGFIIEKPSYILNFASKPLAEYGIKYKTIRGGLISGFKLEGFNYQNKIIADSAELKVKWSRLKQRELLIDNLTLNRVHISRDYLKSLIDSNGSSNDSNSSLPFDKITIKKAHIDIENIIYDNYKINSANLEIKNFKTDMKSEYIGDIKLKLDSNITNLNLMANIAKNGNFKLKGDIEPKRRFLEPLLKEQNITLKKTPKFYIDTSGDLKKLKYYISVNGLALNYLKYKVDSRKLIVNGNYNMEKQYISINVDTILSSNLSKLELRGVTTFNLNDINRTLKFRANSNIKAHNLSIIEPYNINGDINLNASGDMKELKYSLLTKSLKIEDNKYRVDSKKLIVNGSYSVLNRDVNIKNIDTILNSNLANLKLRGDTHFNLKDINNTLGFHLKSNIIPKREFIEEYIKDKNITIQRVGAINLNANGTLKKVNFKVNLKDLRAKRKDIDLKLASLFLNGYSRVLNGDTKVDIESRFLSNVVDGVIKDRLQLNFKDINRTLNSKGEFNLLFKSKYINRFIKDRNITDTTILNNPRANIKIDGNLEALTLKLNGKIDILKDKLTSHLKLNSSPIRLDIIHHRVNGVVNIVNNSKNMGFFIKSRFNGDYTNPKLMKSYTRINIKKFNAFGVNLNPLTPLDLNISSGKRGAFVRLDSKRIKLNISTKNYDNIKFNIDTRKLYLYKIVELPNELHHKFIELHLRGDMQISKKYFNINGYINSNKKIKAKVNIKNGMKGLKAHLSTPHIKLDSYGDIDKRDIKLNFATDSILELQKEVKKLYPFNIAKVDGPLDIKVKLKGKMVWLNITSPKVEFDGFNIEDIGIDGNYKKDLITFNRITLRTTGFKDKKFNKKIHLNRKARIYLRDDKRDILIDMLPNILIIAKGDKKSLRGKLFIKNLPIGHPDYGTMFLNTNINYRQNGSKKSITGKIYSKKMRLFYETKFLDIAYDPDVIVVTKKSKKIKKRLNDNSFLNNTYIDINLKAPKAEYKTPDIYLNFDVNLNINKPFGEPLSLIGKIEDINGHYDQVPKRFKIVNSRVLFKGGEKINPLLDIKVEYELPQVMIYIDIGGDASHPKIEFSSEPPMPKKDIMSYLLFGVSTAKLTNGQGSLSREAELFILNQAARDFAYDFNLDRLFIKDDGTGDGYIIEVGKKITKHNMLIIESSKEGNSYILEHEFDKSIKLRVGQHQKEHPSESIDIFYRKRFK